MVVGWGTHQVFVSAFDDEQVPILNARYEAHALVAQMFVQIVYQHCSVVCLQVATVVRNDAPVGKRHDVASQCQVVFGHLIANAGRLERATAFVHLVQVVTKNGRVGHLRAWGKTIGNGNQPAASAFLGQKIHHGLMCRLQKRLPAKALNRKVGHAVA